VLELCYLHIWKLPAKKILSEFHFSLLNNQVIFVPEALAAFLSELIVELAEALHEDL